MFAFCDNARLKQHCLRNKTLSLFVDNIPACAEYYDMDDVRLGLCAFCKIVDRCVDKGICPRGLKGLTDGMSPGDTIGEVLAILKDGDNIFATASKEDGIDELLDAF
jgi:hypothetical protein